MNIALIGATGAAGSRILAELSRRGHKITAIARTLAAAADTPGATPRPADIHDWPLLTKVLAGHDAVISAMHFGPTDVPTLIGAVPASGAPRYLAVGGAGSLEAAPRLCVLDAPGFPEACRAEAEAGAVFLMQVKAEETLNWRFLSPSALFVPAERIGVFRRGTDQRLSTEAGSSIS